MPIKHFDALELRLMSFPKAPNGKKLRQFDPTTFLATIGDGRKNVAVVKKQTIFAQGDGADAVFYIQTGKVKLTVVSKTGREATIGMLREGNFFGEGALAGQALRMGSAAAMTDCALLRIDKKAMMEALHREHAFSDMFVAYLLARNIRYEEDLVDQLFNSSEKRLARVLLLLAHFGKEGVPETVVPKISQETLADMVGTTRSRVSFFLNRFMKKLTRERVLKADCKSTVRCSTWFCTIEHGHKRKNPNFVAFCAPAILLLRQSWAHRLAKYKGISRRSRFPRGCFSLGLRGSKQSEGSASSRHSDCSAEP